MLQDWPGSIYLFLPHGGQTGGGPWGHGRDAHLPGHLAHAARCHVVGHGDIVEVQTVAVVHVAVTLLGELWRCLLLWEHTGEKGKGKQMYKVTGSLNISNIERGNLQPHLPVASHVTLWPAVHVRRPLESSISLSLLHHRGLRVGHARRKQRALWRAGTPEASVCLLAHTCGAWKEVNHSGETRLRRNALRGDLVVIVVIHFDRQ